MELRKLINNTVVETLQHQTDLLEQQTRLLQALAPNIKVQGQDPRTAAPPPKPEEPWSLDFWRQRHVREERTPQGSRELREPVEPLMEPFGSIHQQLQPLIARAEELVLQALEHRDEQIIRLAESTTPAERQKIGRPASNESLLQNKFVAVCDSFQHRLGEIEVLEQRCRDVVRYLKSAQEEAVNGGDSKVSRLVSEEF